MWEILGQITIPEIMLLFVLLFVLPVMAYLLLRLRRYEDLFGQLPSDKIVRKPKEEVKPKAEKSPEREEVFPYQAKAFLTQPERDCLAALREVLGDEVDVFPKVAVWETVEPTDKEPAHADRLRGKAYDFLVCDRKTGRTLTAVMFAPGKGRPAGPLDEVKKICAAAEANVTFIEAADEYDARNLREILGISELGV